MNRHTHSTDMNTASRQSLASVKQRVSIDTRARIQTRASDESLAKSRTLARFSSLASLVGGVAFAACLGFFGLASPFDMSDAARGEDFQRFQVVPQNPRRPLPWNVTLERNERGASGYAVVHVTITPGPTSKLPIANDTEIRVQIEPSWYSGHTQESIKTFTFPAGAMKHQDTMLIPSDWTPQINWNIRIYVNGREMSGATTSVMPGGNNITAYTEARPSLLFIDSRSPSSETISQVRWGTANNLAVSEFTLPDVSQIAKAMGSMSTNAIPELPQDRSVRNFRIVNDYLGQSNLLSIANFDTLDETWLGYTAVDIAFISLDDLLKLKKDHEVKWRALRKWALSGPTLCVYGVGDQFERLKELEQLLSMPAAKTVPDGPRGTWRALKATDGRRKFSDFNVPLNQYAYSQPMMAGTSGGKATSSNPVTPLPDDKSHEQLLIRELGFGRIVAMKSVEPFPGTTELWEWLLHSIGEDRFRWFRRHGMSASRENPDVRNFPVPDVGRPPVYSFLGLVTMFALFIGPLNYWWLNRKKRLYLLLVSVPFGAGVVTVALLAFAVISDGLHTRVRINSVSYLDQRGEQAASWSRQTYFAGIAPRGGPSYPEETAIYPVDRWAKSWNTTLARMTNWDGGQHLASGYLASRDMTMFVVINSQDRKPKLIFNPRPDGQSYVARNELGVAINLLVARDAIGNYFLARGIAPDSSVELEKTAVATAASLLRTSQVVVESPAITWSERPPSWNYWVQSADAQMAAPSEKTSILNQAMLHLDLDHTPIAPGEFIAVVPRDPEVPIGVKDAQEVAAFHVVMGNWKSGE